MGLCSCTLYSVKVQSQCLMLTVHNLNHNGIKTVPNDDVMKAGVPTWCTADSSIVFKLSYS